MASDRTGKLKPRNALVGLFISLLASALFHMDASALNEDATSVDGQDERMAPIVAAVRAQEAKYRDVEYVVKVTTREMDREFPDRTPELTSLGTRHVVLQGDRIFFRKQAHERVLATKSVREEISAYDGEQTRTVVSGNCANIHLGRFEHPDIYPAHCLSLAHYLVNFPLSAFLSGTEAIHVQPKYPKSVKDTGLVYDFTRVEAHLEGEEIVDGLRCVKVRVNRWYSSRGQPDVLHLWLATERNHFCVKGRLSWPKSEFGVGTAHEMHVNQMRELAPGLWFPTKTTVVEYDRQSFEQQKQVVSKLTELSVEKVDLAPHHDQAFFHDVKLPADLPVFTIKDGTLLGSTLPEPIDGEAGKAKLADVIRQVAEQEKRYRDLEVKIRVVYRFLDSTQGYGAIITEQFTDEHSIIRGPLAYFTSFETHAALAGQRAELLMTWAFDGEWTRTFYHSKPDVEETQFGGALRKAVAGGAEGRHDGVPVHRPHVLLQHRDRIFGPAADLLASSWLDEAHKLRLEFHYCGTAVVDGHPCVKIRRDVINQLQRKPSSFRVLYLATDRNFIPIKLEQYGGNPDFNTLPIEVSNCHDLREIAPGTWYPFHITELALGGMVAQGRIVLQTRRDSQIESATLSPKVDDSFFHRVILPAGTQVAVLDEDGRRLGTFDQPQDGIPTLTLARFLDLRSQAPVTKELRETRRKAFESLIGKHAPEFPQGAQWLNSKPLTWESLRGKVVILDFWAEWNAPSRVDVAQLERLHDAREANGLTVIGIHAAGSARIDHQSDQSIASRLSHVRRRLSREGRKTLGSSLQRLRGSGDPTRRGRRCQGDDHRLRRARGCFGQGEYADRQNRSGQIIARRHSRWR